jgi:hypothetical protein
MATKEEAAETNGMAIVRVPEIKEVEKKEAEEITEKYNLIIDEIHHLSVSTQIHRLTKTIDSIHARSEECKIEIAKYDKMIEQAEIGQNTAQIASNKTYLAVIAKSHTCKEKQDLATKSNDLVHMLEARKAHLELLHIQTVFNEELIKVKHYQIEHLELKVKRLAVQKSLDNDASEIEACHSNILQLKATLP